jgi:ATP-dependent Zn protease
MNFGSQYENEDYSRAWGEPDKPSTKLQEKVDDEMMNYISEAEERAMELLKKHKASLIKIAENLLEKETLDSDEFSKLMDIPKAKAIQSTLSLTL